jgi:hypothetical protein
MKSGGEVPDGWLLVPQTPTEEMIDAGDRELDGDDPCPLTIWRAMLAASPSPSVTQGGWRPIETAPKDGTQIIVFSTEEADPSPTLAVFLAGESDFWLDAYDHSPMTGVVSGKPTHWLPLPPPPGEKP